MNNHKKKMIAPVVVTVLLVVYYLLYFGLIAAAVSGVLKLIMGVVPLILAALTVKVCIERINEIKKGEEDDISKY